METHAGIAIAGIGPAPVSGVSPMPMPWERDSDFENQVRRSLRELLRSARPTSKELVEQVERELGPKARWYVTHALRYVANDPDESADLRAFLADLLTSKDYTFAMLGAAGQDQGIRNEFADLIQEGRDYRGTSQFSEMIEFMAKFRDYSPFNNLLVWTQRPGCRLYLTRAKWHSKFKRRVAEDARPMVILAPRTPVLLVYDVDQTEGPPLPDELESFAQFEGDWDPIWLSWMVANAETHYGIRVDFKTLTTTLAGFATIERNAPGFKMRIVVHDGLDEPSRFGVLCHEIAHVLLGHLGNDADRWWPTRYNLDLQSIEIEAEAAAYVVTRRLGLRGSSANYVSRYLGGNGDMPQGVSPDYIAKVAARLEQMSSEILPSRASGKRSQRAGRGIG